MQHGISGIWKTLELLYEQLDKIKEVGEGRHRCFRQDQRVGKKIQNTRKEIYSNLSGWQKVQLSRHLKDFYTYFTLTRFSHDLQNCMVTVILQMIKPLWWSGKVRWTNGHVVMGHQKGINTKMRQYRNFGMANLKKIPQGPSTYEDGGTV